MEKLNVSIVGPSEKETGGIAQYIAQQRDNVSDDVSVTVYDTSTPNVEGKLSFLRAVLVGFLRMLMYPFRSRRDIVHVHTSHTYSFYLSAFYVLFSAVVWRRPVVLHVHGSSFDEFVRTASPPVRLLQRGVFAASDRIIVLSDYWRQTLERSVSSDKIEVVPNAVSTDAVTPTFNVVPPTIVFVSNHIERKGVREFSEAIRDLNERSSVEFEVEIAGKGPLSACSAELADRYANVTYHGYVSEKHKWSLLSRGSIYVLPTFAEGLPIALLEGMAGGNAVVSTSVGSIPEVVGDENGTVVPPGDVERLTESLEDLVSSPETVERMAQSNLELVDKRYTWDTVSDQLVGIYVDLLESPGEAEREIADVNGMDARCAE